LALGSGTASQEPRYRDGLAVVGLSWTLISLTGAIPFYFSGHLDVWGSIFESFSGFSSTGATAIADLTLYPPGLLFWRSFIQWLGGMGIIVLMVAVLPFLGVGGQFMLKSEVSGPSSDKLRPRVAQTAKILWGLYSSLTALLFILLLAGGLGPFEALCQTLTTISTGGFSNFNQSAAFTESRYIQWVIVVFMFLGSLSIALYWQAICGNWRALVFNREVMFLTFLILIVAGFSTAALMVDKVYASPVEAFFHSIFQTVSIVSTSGLTTTDWSKWPHLCQALLFFLFFVGGCTGSTSGGVKCIRWLLLFKSIHRACRRLIHPRGVFPVRLHGKTMSEQVLENVWLFFLIYFLIMAVATLSIAALGLDLTTALTASASALANVGPALGEIGPTGSYAAIPGPAKAILSLCMLLGRLEFYSFVVLFFPEFWRR
jgi:trk system potassium uptake protein TrkH